MTRTMPLSPFFEDTRRGGTISWMRSAVTEIMLYIIGNQNIKCQRIPQKGIITPPLYRRYKVH